jgi:hypothetical protein
MRELACPVSSFNHATLTFPFEITAVKAYRVAVPMRQLLHHINHAGESKTSFLDRIAVTSYELPFL